MLSSFRPRGPRRPFLVLAALIAASAVLAPLPAPFARAETARAGAKQPRATLWPKLAQYIKPLSRNFPSISEYRKERLDALARFVRSKRAAGERAQLVFVCGDDSRRSPMSQLWAMAAAASYGVDGVDAFSGGEVASAVDARAVAALERAGFQLEKKATAGQDVRRRVSYAKNRPAVEVFSKRYDDPTNPRAGIAAIITCFRAESGCPLMEGAALRVGLPVEDPRRADGMPAESATYDERAKQIATELLYLFSRVGPP